MDRSRTDVEAAYAVLSSLGLVESSDASYVLDRVAADFFASESHSARGLRPVRPDSGQAWSGSEQEFPLRDSGSEAPRDRPGCAVRHRRHIGGASP